MQKPQFGKLPLGERLERIEKSPNYHNGKFHNLVEKPTITEGYSMAGEIYKTIFGKKSRLKPVDSLPSQKINLHKLDRNENILVWFGHSSVFIQIGGKRLLVDPIFSGKATPLPWGIKAYKGSDVYKTEDIPEIDYLLISHDHYDHLDYKTALALKNKIKHVVCGLGVGAHFEHWGYTPNQIMEKDWNEKVDVADSFFIHTETSQHDSGRSFKRGRSLWLSFLIESPTLKIYISGDGGYDLRFEEIGKKYGPINWAIMENGQYNKAWQSVHNLPEQVDKATVELNAQNLLTVHHSKFTLGRHPWDEPLRQISLLSENKPYRLATPMIGELVNLDNPDQKFEKWWEKIN
ncbi:MBL fold metallo-hydrolase [Pedobacter antarcticus]|uniref:MBL fold metallo-hydrolase n=1 Tax=Pedobacter antarcticus TaxID=34086 RepID=UPI00293149D1|nr:MBL fold metallo-hydrolase [Pedobacter antarcticus]